MGRTTSSVDATLAHYGILGMKWGKRKGNSSAPSSSKGGPSADHLKVQQLRKKPMNQLTNSEMQALVTRMNLEQQYSRLNPSKVSKGQKYMSTALSLANTANSMIAFANSPAGKLIRDALK